VPALRLLPRTDDDAALAAAALDGDDAARAQIVARHAPAVYRTAHRLLRDAHDAHDATQDTFAKAFAKLHTFDPTRSLRAWLLGIARNTAIDEHRRRRRLSGAPVPDLPSEAPGPSAETSRRQRAAAVHAALDDLPPMYREILVLYHFEHLKYVEISEALELPLGTVMNRIFRARAKLRDALAARGHLLEGVP
jgi:RNA polymerase sigma-70 factor (ECF subfamily)